MEQQPSPEKSDENKDNKQGIIDKIQQLGQTNVPQLSQDTNIHCLTIVGQIEGHMQLPPQNKTTKYEHVIPQIVAIEQNPKIEGLLVILNTVGGDVEAGLAISEMLASLSKPTVSIVLGGGSFNRCTDRGFMRLQLYCWNSNDDYSSHSFNGTSNWCPTNI